MKKEEPRIVFQRDSASALRRERAFFPRAEALRGHFVETFSDPYRAHPGRFCWDPWSIPGQYRLLRTPAESFFPKEVYRHFLKHLLSWGREQLGCQMISHPWLSAYLDGCHQRLHSDVPHGPFSFVYSLTPWASRKFTGGETLIARPRLLRYFSEMAPNLSHEEADLIQSVPALYNQLTVFDPRYPHGVREVRGAENLLDSRLVIHGWFTEPRPMLEGALSARGISRPLDRLAGEVLGGLPKFGNHAGLLSLRLEIAESGRLEEIRVLTAHLIDRTGALLPRSQLSALLRTIRAGFPRARGRTRITLPLEVA